LLLALASYPSISAFVRASGRAGQPIGPPDMENDNHFSSMEGLNDDGIRKNNVI
jgi:hypothetical protein